MHSTKFAFASTLFLPSTLFLLSSAFVGFPAGATLLQPTSLQSISLQSTSLQPNSVSENNLRVAQTAVGACTVEIQPGSSLNIRLNPTTDSPIIGSLRSGERVALGVTDGSEGANWTRIIAPVDGYVASQYLTNCLYRY